MEYSLDLNQVYKKIVKLSNKYYTSFINSNPSTKLFFISLFLCWFTLNFSILNIVDLSKNFWNVTLNLIENFF